jgi:hypothetical protein
MTNNALLLSFTVNTTATAIYSGGLDFSGPVEEYFLDGNKVRVDTMINLTGVCVCYYCYIHPDDHKSSSK